MTRFSSLASMVMFVSGIAFVISVIVRCGIATPPSFSMDASAVVTKVISRSVVRISSTPSLAEKRTLLRIGMVDLVGVAFARFCKAVWREFLDIETFIKVGFFLVWKG